MNNFRIHSNVIPGDQIIIDAKIVNEKLNSFKFESTCHVNDKLVAKAEFLASMVERSEIKLARYTKQILYQAQPKLVTMLRLDLIT